jgi:hypothetical protein
MPVEHWQAAQKYPVLIMSAELDDPVFTCMSTRPEPHSIADVIEAFGHLMKANVGFGPSIQLR